MSILIIKNIAHEGPGRLGDLLDRHEIKADIVNLSVGEILPDYNRYRAIIVLGGPMSVNDNSLHMNVIKDYVKVILKAKTPFWGICLGMQILASVAGADIIPAPEKEIGWFNGKGEAFQLFPTEAGKADPVFVGIPFPAVLFHLHGETISASPHIMLLASGNGCACQVIRVGTNAYGIQGHIEMTEAMLMEWWHRDPDLHQLDGDRLIRDYRRFQRQYDLVGESLFSNFLKSAGIIA